MSETKFTNRNLAQTVAQSIWEAEDAIDRAVAAVARVATTAADGRLSHKVPAMVGNKALAHTSASLSALSDARSFIVEAHGEFSLAAEDLKVNPARLFGPGQTKPERPIQPSALTEAA
ncbi:hypothetical protein IWC96_04995 [Brevundimonas sp. BAL450]|uniref:hypothetical protein n=1 Tax=Brevundimonas sp. BAL450 TaxID=1708162 RepID=UPI0018C8E337|nr:hypothetical protein [Brevundimonas sp. BAL450]MBG7614638.1 hypothetical protein [Brevundimonas sp. BAL450]